MNTIDLPDRQDRSPGMTVALNVRAEIARAGVKHSDLAAFLNWKPNYLSRRLTGTTPFTIDELYQVANALNIDVMLLMPKNRISASSGQRIANFVLNEKSRSDVGSTF